MTYDINKNKKRIKGQTPGLFNVLIMIVGLSLCALGYDLGLQVFATINGCLFLMEFSYAILWFIDLIIFLIIVKRKCGTIKDCLKDEEEKKRSE